MLHGMQAFKLRSIPLFAGLSDRDAETLMAALETRSLHANHTIFWAGDTGADFFIITSGHVHLTIQDESGKESPLAALGPGDYFGELSLLDGGPRTATCRTRTDVTLLVLSRNSFYSFLAANSKAALHVLETLGRRQRNTLEQLRGVRNPNAALDETTAEGPLWPRIADKIASVSASPKFLFTHALWFALWTGYNSLAHDRAFDPFPFGLLTMIVSLEAIFLSIFVLVSANRQSERDRIRADVDHQVNLKAHHELMLMQRKLDSLRDAIESRGAERDPTAGDL